MGGDIEENIIQELESIEETVRDSGQLTANDVAVIIKALKLLLLK